MPNKVTINIDKGKGTITEGADTGLGKILAAAGRIKLKGREVKIEKPK